MKEKKVKQQEGFWAEQKSSHLLYTLFLLALFFVVHVILFKRKKNGSQSLVCLPFPHNIFMRQKLQLLVQFLPFLQLRV